MNKRIKNRQNIIKDYIVGDFFMEKNKDELKKENTTKYGEFVCSEYQWLPLEKQKEQANKMANMTKKEKGKKD